MSGREIRLGGPLFRSASPVLVPFLCRRKDILSRRLSGLLAASAPDHDSIRMLQGDIQYLEQQISLLRQKEDVR